METHTMLVLSRRVGQRIVLPSLDVTITVARIQGQAVRVGIDAPHGVEIFRAELLEERPAAAAAATRKCRTLVVDDDRNERTLLAGLLSMHGCECATAADGQDAL